MFSLVSLTDADGSFCMCTDNGASGNTVVVVIGESDELDFSVSET